MKYFLGTAAVTFAFAVPMSHATPVAAQTPSFAVNPQIEIAYVQPTNVKFGPIYDRLKDRKVLETLQQFLAPLILDRKLTVKIDQCGATSIRYKRQGPVTICYEYIGQIEALAPKATVVLSQGPVTTESAIAGPVVQAVLHELAIAAFDILEIPVWGRLDDAADRVAAFIMLQFGPDVAWNTVVGTAWFLSANATSAPDFADVRGVIAQRYYTTLCIAYGGERKGAYKIDPTRTFASFVENATAGSLPADRARTCGEEYDAVKQAFDDEIMPHLDQSLLKDVQAANWVSFGAGK